MVHDFLETTDGTHLLFIDSDIEFEAMDIIALLAFDKDVIGIPYPKKTINWDNVRGVLKKDPHVAPEVLEKVVGEYAFNAINANEKVGVFDLHEVMETGTGLMLIKRDVFTQISEAFPQLKYKSDDVTTESKKKTVAFFDTVIDTSGSITGGGTDRYLSEDYFFCRLWRRLGGKIWICPWMKTKHLGVFPFVGDMPSIAQHVGNTG